MAATSSNPRHENADPAGKWVAETTFHVRYAETDQMGIVHHSAYVPWLEEARSALSRQYGRSYADFERAGLALTVTQLNLRFITPARYDRAVTVRARVSQLRSRQVCFEYEVVDTQTGQRLATGFTEHICIDRAGRPARIPQEWHHFWSGLMH